MLWVMNRTERLYALVEELRAVTPCPGPARRCCTLLVQAHQQVGQLAADHLGAEQVRQLGECDEPLRVPGRPVVISPSVIRNTWW